MKSPSLFTESVAFSSSYQMLRVTLLLFSLLYSLSSYSQNDTIAIGKTAKTAIVSAEKMNVVYRGMSNPISIYVPNNIPFMASAPGLSKDDKGKYILTPGIGNEVIVSAIYLSILSK
jgi:gliding motility-associated GldM-like protein